MNYKNKMLPLLLAAAMLTAALCSCSDDASKTADASGNNTADAYAAETLTQKEYEEYSIADVESAFPDIPYVLAFDSGDGTADDYVTYDEYRYYQLLYKNYFDGGDSTYWTTNPGMTDRVIGMYSTEILRNHTVLAECAEYGLLLTEEEQTALDRENAEFVAAFGGKDYFREALDKYYMTEYYFNYQSELELLYQKLETYYREHGQILTEDADIRAVLDTDAFIRCKHILIKNDTGEDTNANRQLAEEILSRINAGEDYDTLMREYTEDPGLETDPDGYYFFRGEMETTFEEASFALADGEMSGVVESTYGYHIILRCEKDSAYLDENFAAIRDTYLALRFYQVLDETAAGWTSTVCDNYEEISDWDYAASIGNVYPVPGVSAGN